MIIYEKKLYWNYWNNCTQGIFISPLRIIFSGSNVWPGPGGGLEEEWSYRLVPLLTGQALEAYLAMDEEQAMVYTDLKQALLEKFKISPETYCQRF